jgi:hypothetical protein
MRVFALRRWGPPAGIAAWVVVVALHLATARPAAAVVLTVTPTVAVGISNNVTNLATTQPRTSVFGALTASAQLELTRATSVHRVAYTVRTIQYADGTAGSTSNSALWGSQFSLNSQLTLTVGADASIYAVSSIQIANPATVNASTAAVSSTPATLVSTDATQTLSYQPNAAERYGQNLLVGYTDTWRSTSSVPRTLRIDGGLTADRIHGASSYSLHLLAEDFERLDPGLPVPGTTIVTGTDHALSLQLLAGWRRDLSVTTNVSLEAGPMVVFGIADHPQWVPGVIANAGYRSMPWYWTLTASQQPLVNPFLGQLLIADAVSLRLSLPLNARETFVASGFGGYTYGRAVAPTEHVLWSARIYDLIQAGASLAYQFERLPFFVSLDYLETRQNGSTTVGQASLDSHRRVVSVTFGGNFAWGEGNHGIPLRQPSAPIP